MRKMDGGQIRILLCEDDLSLGELLSEALMIREYEVVLCRDGAEGWETFNREKNFDLCLLDVMMPVKDGLSLARDIRSMDSQVPIIFLTAMGMRENVLAGLRAGADDYMTKPFSMEELLLRLEAILRRSLSVMVEKRKEEVYQIGDYCFETTGQILSYKDGLEVRTLTTKENDLLSLLCSYANQTLERSVALKEIWGVEDDNEHSKRSMDVYVTKLRRMLNRDPRVEIKNVHGKGYKLVMPV